METIINARVKLIVPGDLEETVSFAASYFVKIAKECIEKRGYFIVALSGGSTPKKVYETLAKDFSKSIDWQKVYLFFSDERAVPKDHVDSNYKMAMESGFLSLGLSLGHIFPIPTDGDLEDDAKAYENLFLKTVRAKKFDLMLLGIGDDGHTASLFPHTKALNEKEAFFTPNYIVDKKVWRITATYKAICESSNIVVLAFGEGKQEILKKVLLRPYKPEDYPIQKVGTEENRAVFIVDNSASRLLI